MAPPKTFKLSNGLELPSIALGTVSCLVPPIVGAEY
jgi:hypothetical protein